MTFYHDILDESGGEARAREAELVGRSLALMRGATQSEAAPAAALEAARFAERLWSHLIEDLGSPRNALDPDLRADLISIGLFVMRETRAAADGTGRLDAAIEVTEQLHAGLSA